MREPHATRFAAPAVMSLQRATAATAVVAILSFSGAVASHEHSRASANVDIVDRTTGVTLAVYDKDGQRYVIGAPGHEYAIRIRNETRERILAVTSVDGVNVVTGETASPGQSGYVIEAGGSVEIAGWRRSLYKTSAFYFTDLGDSYAARTGRPDEVGVIGIAVFRERPPPVTQLSPADRLAARPEAPRAEPSLGSRPVPAAQASTTEASRANAGEVTSERLGAKAESAADAAAPRPLAKLGTGFGRDESSLAQRVRFERASDAPAQTIAIRYDRYENLAAMGVLPGRRYAERTPDPFPALRFVPPPR